MSHLGWRWTQWTILFSASVTLITMIGTRETFHTTIMHQHSEDFYLPLASPLSSSAKLKLFATSSIFLPIHMLVAEPIVAFICLYVACGFAIIFSLFAVVPLIFQEVYMFDTEDSGLAFLSIVVGFVPLFDWQPSNTCETFLVSLVCSAGHSVGKPHSCNYAFCMGQSVCLRQLRPIYRRHIPGFYRDKCDECE